MKRHDARKLSHDKLTELRRRAVDNWLETKFPAIKAEARKALAAALKPIYTAPSAEAAKVELDRFESFVISGTHHRLF